jgi:transcriptional regulator with XRE-family HTH domain
MDIGKTLATLRKNNGLNQREFAQSIGVSNGAVAMWETNKRQPDIEMLIKIANYYHVSLDYLLGISNKIESVSMLEVCDKELLDYFHKIQNTAIISEQEKAKVTQFFPYATALSDEELDLIEYYNELSVKDRRWIMGQMIDLIKKADEKRTEIPKAQ